MLNPLHPAVVHFPLVLGIVLPIVAVVALWATLRQGGARGPWMTLVAVSVALVVSAWVALQTGEAQEDAVEAVVAEGAIHTHEEMAEGLLVGSGIAALLILTGLAPGRIGRGARVLSVVASLAVPVLAFRVGDSGGKLVYEHGAAEAYVRAGPSGAQDGRREHREREEAEGEHRGP